MTGGVAALDFDGDGRIGIAIEGRKSNRDAIGSVVRVTTASGKKLRAFVSTAGSYLSASEKMPPGVRVVVEAPWTQRLSHSHDCGKG